MIEFKQCDIALSETYSLTGLDWQVEKRQHWVITGANGSGKSALGAVLAGEGQVIKGSLSGLPEKAVCVSFETQRAIIEEERRRDDSDITDKVFEGTSVETILLEGCLDQALMSDLIQQFKLADLLHRGFRNLSTGETRKVMIVRALAQSPELLILDEPFDGLDQASAELLSNLLEAWSQSINMILILNRLDEMPEFITHLLYLRHGSIAHKIETQNEAEMADLFQLMHLRRADLKVPTADPSVSLPPLDPADPLVRMRAVGVAYGDGVVFDQLDWEVQPQQHWQVAGPNGSGKTCLLNLITGDHPQCYVNDIFVFGFQRGQGESIWQIKQYIGYVSTALQWEYRVSINLSNVIISGFYDSIGLYQSATDSQKLIATQWLEMLGMTDRADQPFNQLSYGDQRLLLIARAMVKHPKLLILDEPCLGLDDINRSWVLALIEKICHGSETTVIYVNHHASDRIDGIEHTLQLEGTIQEGSYEPA